jgi:signal transduction histidine kinase
VSAFESAIGAALGMDAVTVRFPIAEGRWINPAGDSVLMGRDQIQLVRDSANGGKVLAAVGNQGHAAATIPAGLVDLLRLAAERARLQCEVRSRLDELADSRRRLLNAGDIERRHLEQQLRSGALAHIDTVEALITRVDGMQPLRDRVAATRTELDGVARGIDPLATTCLRNALDQIATRSGLNVTVDALEIDPPAPVARAVWYTCSEAIANAAKHAPGSSASITLRDHGTAVELDVEDHGPGGADPDGGGLRGLADRAAALGGSLSVSTGHSGTRISLRIPVSEMAGS